MHHFLKVTDFTLEQAQEVFSLAKSLKDDRFNTPASLNKQSWGLLFYKSSTRTRVSFEVGVNELGGFPIVLNSQNTQIGRGETVEDTSKVLSRYLHGLVIRAYEHEVVTEFAKHATMPIINGLTDFNHPCQLYTDIFTLLERYSPDAVDINTLKGKKVAFLGDSACNMANSWILTAAMFGMEIVVSGPEGYEPKQAVIDALKADGLPVNYTYTSDAKEAVKDADAIYTDVWVSMGDEAEAEQRLKEMAPYQVNAELLALAKPDAYFMHCLPAHAGEEVSQDVLDSPQSIIFDEAENRLHAQKAIMAKLVELNG
ncbi:MULTISPECIES: ornithine carbamoyltransferase [unclassified Lentimonas]|uniref:ornithine carbamoyltransferase n=1 Tax=unclassified Lentimonas TaxID=2630993 RepID=UPI001323AF15|nr:MULTISPECIES: ornithine carbamoyltransferase [unclassified Lentimonas]CAA6678722.1 Ornithine carbamoyltransferase (EC [Lentimonas sp. CC4]CAA6683708.1 Ornithine carbamoyltransferase (EC [Lentimonas sp. CC6]CAA7074444.1 Ornithine carbamoyltransferase (EC [Lentimonas sp. CC4]CAA7169054.1 Ornithine carbamoyltransferase (EC [Lentimonas sp. CC21]CAA7180538.1 Ornithine carbamoyltransferase (EC [Lentimonas sp. CC8]